MDDMKMMTTDGLEVAKPVDLPDESSNIGPSYYPAHVVDIGGCRKKNVGWTSSNLVASVDVLLSHGLGAIDHILLYHIAQYSKCLHYW